MREGVVADFAKHVVEPTDRFNYDWDGVWTMRTVLATKLSDRPVLGADGETLGTVHNLTMNLETGELVSVVVDPDGDIHGFERDGDGRALVPAACIEGLDDYLVVDRSRAGSEERPA